MLAACHLFIGLLIGLALFKLGGDRRLVPMAALGALLPDLIDKPIGHILLQQTVDFGRIYGHTLAFLFACVAIGMVLKWRRGSDLLIALSLGVASHLILDSMWSNPVTLFYPALGDFWHQHFPNYFEISFLNEIFSPFEWLFFLLSAWILTDLYKEKLRSKALAKLVSILGRISYFLIIGLVAVSIAYVIMGTAGVIELPSVEYAIILVTVSLAGSLALRWMSKKDVARTSIAWRKGMGLS